jgi:hypothetical protein
MWSVFATIAVVTIGVLGFRHVHLWWIPVMAIVTTAIYLGMRWFVVLRFAERGSGAVVSWLAMTYVMQVVTVSIVFGVGCGIGALFR